MTSTTFGRGSPLLPDGRGWVLENFLPRLDLWVEQEEPPDHVRLAALGWIMQRLDDPYAGVRRERGFDNLWFGLIPGSRYGDQLVAVCSYWIFERERRVQCDSFASLSSPA